jgi:hypothetical protein
MATKSRPSFDPKSFLAVVGEGRGIGEYRKDQIVRSHARGHLSPGMSTRCQYKTRDGVVTPLRTCGSAGGSPRG